MFYEYTNNEAPRATESAPQSLLSMNETIVLRFAWAESGFGFLTSAEAIEAVTLGAALIMQHRHRRVYLTGAADAFMSGTCSATSCGFAGALSLDASKNWHGHISRMCWVCASGAGRRWMRWHIGNVRATLDEVLYRFRCCIT